MSSSNIAAPLKPFPDGTQWITIKSCHISDWISNRLWCCFSFCCYFPRLFSFSKQYYYPMRLHTKTIRPRDQLSLHLHISTTFRKKMVIGPFQLVRPRVYSLVRIGSSSLHSLVARINLSQFDFSRDDFSKLCLQFQHRPCRGYPQRPWSLGE